MKEFVLPKTTRRLWQLRVLLAGILLAGLSVLFTGGFFSWLYNAVVAAVPVALLDFWYIPAAARRFRVRVEEDRITVFSGVIFQNRTLIPNRTTVYTETFSLPLDRLFGLQGVILHAARGVLFLPQMNREAVESVTEKGQSKTGNPAP